MLDLKRGKAGKDQDAGLMPSNPRQGYVRPSCMIFG